jgi:hypothetical protein
MPPSAVFLLARLIAAVLLIASGSSRLVTLTLVTLALSGLVTPAEAFAGSAARPSDDHGDLHCLGGDAADGPDADLGQRLLPSAVVGTAAVMFTTLSAALLSLFMNNLAAAGVCSRP